MVALTRNGRPTHEKSDTTMNALTKLPSLQQTPALVMVFIAGVLGTAYFFEHVLGILPCALCQYQRLAWWIALGVAGVTFYLRRNGGLLIAGLILTAVVILAGAATAGYHVGVEQKWWEGPASCSSFDPAGLTTEQLMAQIQSAPVVACDEVAWDFLGVSMAGWNALISLGLAVLWAFAAWPKTTTRHTVPG